jgi:hypothetical protein
MTMETNKDEMIRLSRLLDKGLETLRESAQELAEAEHDYRLRRGQLWAETAGQGYVVAERDALVDAASAGERRSRDLAEAKRQAALESVRSRRQQLSAWQSWIAAERAEAEFTRTAP